MAAMGQSRADLPRRMMELHLADTPFAVAAPPLAVEDGHLIQYNSASHHSGVGFPPMAAKATSSSTVLQLELVQFEPAVDDEGL